MKRLLLIVAVMLFAAAAFADVADRDVLITADGTVYSIISEPSENGQDASLALTVQADGKTTRSVVPDSVANGVNARPTLAYDAESKTLFVVWMRMPNATSSELLIAGYQNDKWRPAVAIDYKRALRYNLSVGITRRVQQLQRDGTIEDGAALVLHAAWWEQGGENEGPRYAVMGLGGGTVSEPDIHDMTEFIADGDAKAELDETFNHDFLRHVAVLEGPTPNAVDVVFADPHTRNFYRATLKPIADVRIHIPVGARPGGTPKLGGPKSLSIDWSGRTSTISSHDGKTLIFCNAGADKVSYVKFHDGEWSAAKQVALSDKVTAEMALAALARMAAAE